MAETSELRARHMARAHDLETEFVGRLRWDAEALAAHRRRALRDLLAHARARSPWYRERLADIDLAAVDPDDLSALPVLTKADLMANFDDVVTDPRLRLDTVEEFLATAVEGGYLFDEYTGMTTGGSTGHRAVGVFDFDALAVWFLSFFRRLLLVRAAELDRAGRPMSIAWVGAAHPSHASAVFARTFNDPGFVNVRLPVTLPLTEIVDGLNRAQTQVLFAYPSMLRLLAAEARVGRLRIDPARIWSAAEPLFPEIRAEVEAAFGVRVSNAWGATEIGALATPCDHGRMHLGEDIGILEAVDAQGRPVAPGERSAKIFVTNLFNRALPFVRYEITDELTVAPEPCPCGEITACIEDPQGRLDDSFVYPDASVHPHVFRSALGRRREIGEYQVHQTARGARVLVRCVSEFDPVPVAEELELGLRALGLPDPEVRVERVEQLERILGSGKLKRFVPLPVLVDGGGVR